MQAFQIRCISLPEADSRRNHISQELGGVPCSWEFFDAIKIRQGLPTVTEYDQRRRFQLYGYDMTPGEIGCFLSHRSVWSECVRSGMPFVIFEDDIKLQVDATELILIIASILEEPSFQLVRLAGIFSKPVVPVGNKSGRSIVRYLRDPSGAAAYIVRPEAAQKLLSHSDQFSIAVDDFMALEFAHGIAFLGIMPYPVDVGQFDSTIGDRKKPPLSAMKKLKREFFRMPIAVKKILYKLKQYGIGS